ncbi:BLOC-2 complex member HPS5 [Dirofilaria immitis]
MKEDDRNSLPFTHVFAELTSLEELSFPTSSSTRIKFTCLDASAHYLAVGSTSGTVYLFSRFASKYRNRVSSVPIQVISIKDGPIIKLSISPNEKYLATASKRGSLTITLLVGIGQNPITLISTDCHIGSDEYGQSIHITELCWCSDSSKIYAGDTKGRISQTLIQNRNFFRSSTDIIFQTDSEIVQFDLRGDCLLASTLTRCCVCDLKTYSCIQVGKRLRKGHFGAVFYSVQQKRKSLYEEENNGIEPTSTNDCNELTVIFASRPNGRLWEANGRGVVYSTHQYRNLKTVCRFPVVSFKKDNLFDNIASANKVRSINFGLLTLIKCQSNLFLMTKTDRTFFLIDPVDSHMVLISTIDCIGSVSEYAVNDADIFLLSETGSLQKLTLFTVEKAVEKLYWRQCYSQAAQLIYINYVVNKNYNSAIAWNYEQLEDILNKITFHHSKSYLTRNMLDILHKLLNELKKNDAIESKPKATVHQLSSGIHRVVQIMQNSGYEDDFTFRAPSPLRLRSKSTLNIEVRNEWKRRSLPLNRESMMRTGEDKIKFENPKECREKLINEARILLLDAEKTQTNQLVRNSNVESLRTLLDSSNNLILFDQQVTINDVTKDLVVAKKFQQMIGDHKNDKQKQKQRTAQLDFKTLFGRRDPLEILEKCVESMPLNINVNVAHLRTIRRNRRGARIVKGIKPLGRRSIMSKTEYEKSEGCEVSSEQQSIKRDFIAGESLNLNCNETPEEKEGSKHNSNDQSSEEDDIRRLNKSYVIEKNFVAVQPIEMIWTMDGDGEENDSVGMKSLEATMTLSDGDKSLMQSSETAISSKTLTLSETGKLDGKNSVYCHDCGLHRLWHYVMIFGPKMAQLRVTVDQFAIGGVPSTIEQWTKLFEFHTAAAKDDESSSAKLCDACATFFEFDDRLKQEASSLREMVERIEKRSIRKKYIENLVQTEAKEWDEDLVYRIFFKNITFGKKSRIEKRVDINSHFESSRKESEFEDCSKKFLWLPAVKISQLLLCMRYCEGVNTVFEFLKNNKKLASCLTIEDWQWLAIMKAYECKRFLDLMPKEVITDLLTELKISEIEDVGSISSVPACNNSGMVSNSKSLGGCLIVSVDGNCTCCTLPLKMQVTHSDGYITIFRCGHLYHQICLREANLSHCLRCEMERRRHRQKQQQMDSKTVIANPSHSPFGKSSRQLPTKAIRTSVTSPSNMKVQQKT